MRYLLLPHKTSMKTKIFKSAFIENGWKSNDQTRTLHCGYVKLKVSLFQHVWHERPARPCRRP